jgi:hypothetical protein
VDDVVKPFGQTDVLLLYGIVSEKLKEFLEGREIASKTWLPHGNIPYFLKRGSKLPPLFAEDFVKVVTPEFLKTRSEHSHVKEIETLTSLQKRVWNYFVPRKLIDFFYATNGEGVGKPIDRVFFDIDRGKEMTAEQAKEVAKLLIRTVKEDNDLKNLLGEAETFVCWTGNSFHVYIFFDEKKPNSFYERYFQYSKHNPLSSFTGRWAKRIDEGLDFKVVGGHEKISKAINIDPSQTPSGKLCRVPLGSLHMFDARTVDGVSIPLTEDMLEEDELIIKLEKFRPNDVIKNLDLLTKRLPKKFR